jgi:class 3 adenylate cyclase
MLTLPAPILNYLLKTTFVDRAPAYLCVSQEGHLIHWGGHLSEYGISDLQPGSIGTQVFFLEGLLPLNGAELFLPCLKTDIGRSVDVYLFSAESCDWVLLLDATADEQQRELLQQYRNQLSLLQKDSIRQIERSLRSSHPSPPRFTLPLERKNLTILAAELRGLMSFSEQQTPDAVFRVFNLYLRTIIQAIATEAGLVDRLLGEAITACFGVLPATSPAPTHAIQAGLKILTAVQQINHLRQARQQPTFEIGIGIASGSTAFGILGDRRHRVLGAIGYSVNLATALQQQANPGEILIDENTFNQATLMQQHFSAIDRSILQFAQPVKIYSTSGGSSNE